MRTITIILFLSILTACNTSDATEQSDSIRYVVKDLSDAGQLVQITFTSNNGNEFRIFSNEGEWERTEPNFEEGLDATLQAIGNSFQGNVHLEVSIYENGELVKMDETQTENTLSITYFR